VLLITCSLFAKNEENATALNEQTLVASFDEIPTKLYKNQLFVLRIKALVGVKEGAAVTYQLSNSIGLKPLNQGSTFKQEDDGSFSLLLLYKVIAQKVRVPDIMVSFDGAGTKDGSLLDGREYTSLAIPQSASSTDIVAASLRVNNYKIDKYDNANNILALDIGARLANLEDFKLKNITTQGANSLKVGSFDSSLYYYLIIPSSQDSMEFQYFNSEKGELVTVAMKLDFSKIEDKVSTQTDLSPKSKDKALYVFIVVVLLALILCAIYYFKREKIFLVLIIAVVCAGFLFLFVPNEQAVLKKECVVYLLPTESSTPFFKATDNTPAEKIKEADGYIKIKLGDGKIGWAKAECVGKN
jgi:hypothetical protein